MAELDPLSVPALIKTPCAPSGTTSLCVGSAAIPSRDSVYCGYAMRLQMLTVTEMIEWTLSFDEIVKQLLRVVALMHSAGIIHGTPILYAVLIAWELMDLQGI